MHITIHYTIQSKGGTDHTGTHVSTFAADTCKLDALSHALDLLAGRVYTDHGITRTTFTRLEIQFSDQGENNGRHN